MARNRALNAQRRAKNEYERLIMKSWETLDADKVKIINTHFTPGRSGNSIRYIVVHHNLRQSDYRRLL